MPIAVSSRADLELVKVEIADLLTTPVIATGPSDFHCHVPSGSATEALFRAGTFSFFGVCPAPRNSTTPSAFALA